MKGAGLVPFYYIKPSTDGAKFKNKTDLLTTGWYMIDYFSTEVDAVDHFIRNNPL